MELILLKSLSTASNMLVNECLLLAQFHIKSLFTFSIFKINLNFNGYFIFSVHTIIFVEIFKKEYCVERYELGFTESTKKMKHRV